MQKFFSATRLAFTPHGQIGSHVYLAIGICQLVLFLFLWSTGSIPFIPKPLEIVCAFFDMVRQDGLIDDFFVSFRIFVEATAIAFALSLCLAYSTVMPFFRPAVALVSKLRYWSMIGLTIIFTLLVSGGHGLKIALLVFGMTVFLATDLVKSVASVTQAELDYARSLRLSPWEVVWHTVVRGKLDEAMGTLRVNMAIAWMMLPMIEGLVRAEGGLGVALLNQNKHMHLANVYAINLGIILVAIGLDFILARIHGVVCPHSLIRKERK